MITWNRLKILLSSWTICIETSLNEAHGTFPINQGCKSLEFDVEKNIEREKTPLFSAYAWDTGRVEDQEQESRIREFNWTIFDLVEHKYMYIVNWN